MKQTQINKIEWKKTELGEVLDYEQPSKYIVNKISKEKINGSVPVLTANKGFLLGYSDEKEGIYDKLPVIIFDDFTTDKKFVDFKFKVKSSAMKMLRPKTNEINLKFIYYMIQSIKVNFSTHKRYYLSLYQYEKIPIPFSNGKPNLNEQERIVSILEKAEKQKDKIRKSEELIDEYLKSVFAEMFGNPNLSNPKYEKIDFIKCIEKEASNNKLKIKQSEFLNEGKYPIIDQGNNFIAGYTNDKNKVYSEKLPVIVFGDHTRAIKFIEFPFALGADGVKILVPRDNFNPYYFYYCIKLLDIPSAGYSRHYKFLKFKKIPFPPLPLQQKFAQIVEHVEKMKEHVRKTKLNSEELFNSLIDKAFKGEL